MNQFRAILLFLTLAVPAKGANLFQDTVHVKSSHPKMTITEVLQKHTQKWMEIPGVIGTGEGKSDDKPCILVLIKHKSEVIKKKIPKSVDGYKVILEVTGEIKAIQKKD
jgi:hypothetical protein